MAVCFRVSDTKLECCNPLSDKCYFVDSERSAKEVVKQKDDSGKGLFQRFLDLLAGKSSEK